MTRGSSRQERRSDVGRQPEDWLDRLARLELHFGRFVRDAIGVFLVALALVSLLALLGLTQGALLVPWTAFLRRWLGWGSYLFVLGVAGLGVLVLRRSDDPPRWGRLIALELAALFSLAVFTLLGGGSLERAELGLDGGRLGWGMNELVRRLLGPFWGGAVIVLVWLFFLMSGFGLWALLERYLERLVEGGAEGEQISAHLVGDEIPAATTETHVRPARKRPVRLPPEFRKSLPMPPPQNERPATPPPRDERLPPLDLLVTGRGSRPDERTINQTAGLIEKTLAEFGIPAQVIGFRVGPTVTQFAVQPGFIEKNGESKNGDAHRVKVRVAQIAALQRDLALALSAERLRIEAPVPGRPYVGIEVPNPRAALVHLRPILESEVFYRVNSPLAIALGRDVSGQPVVADLARMPHLLIAGATGSGKSVFITSVAVCLAMNNTPEDLRMVMIDSKMVELIRFNGLPHLYGKVETDLKRIQGVLRWLVAEMEHRYRLLEAARVRDLAAYNRRLRRRKAATSVPRIVVLIDELADLMMAAPDQTEHHLVRLAQMARATGIHLVVATQRPSTDVVTGLIKANFPARLSFAVASSVDSRVILDMGGAETLLGRGDMLFLDPESGTPVRAQGVMVTDQEIERLITYWQKETQPEEVPPPWEGFLSEPVADEDEALVEKAIELIRRSGRASASFLQRQLRIGYPRAARLLDRLEEMGVVGPSQGGGREREVLIDTDDEAFDEDA